MNASGLHARPANAFVKEAVRHAGCNILIKKDGKTYMGKSIVSVLSACVKCGTEIELVADGNDEAQALQDMAVSYTHLDVYKRQDPLVSIKTAPGKNCFANCNP